MSNIRLANVTRGSFNRAQTSKRLPQLSPDGLSDDQTAALAIWAAITRRVPLTARASRAVYAMAERHARAILADPSRWFCIAAWLTDEPEPICVFSQRPPLSAEPDDGLLALVVVPLTPVARDLLGRIETLGREEKPAVAA